MAVSGSIPFGIAERNALSNDVSLIVKFGRMIYKNAACAIR